MKIHNFKLGELFSGPGGIGLGAVNTRIVSGSKEYRIEHAWANDFDEDSCKTYIRNICPQNPKSVICDDVRKLDIESLPKIDGFAYGFPCNDFSVVGEQKGFHGKFGPLYTYGVKVINHFKPKFFIAENVAGITSANEGKSLKTIVDDLRTAGDGYNITMHLYKCEEYGIAQIRRRVIIVGIDRSLGVTFQVPAPTTLKNSVTARQAIENPLIPANAPNNDRTTQSAGVVERLKHIKPGQNAWNADLPARLRLKVKGAKLSQIYRRLDPDKPSYTLTGSGGGGTHGYHWKENRALTNRERARIQSFPDTYVFEGSRESVRKQIGMAVPPRIAEEIFTAILKTLAGVKYPHVKANLNYLMVDDTSVLNELNLVTSV